MTKDVGISHTKAAFLLSLFSISSIFGTSKLSHSPHSLLPGKALWSALNWRESMDKRLLFGLGQLIQVVGFSMFFTISPTRHIVLSDAEWSLYSSTLSYYPRISNKHLSSANTCWIWSWRRWGHGTSVRTSRVWFEGIRIHCGNHHVNSTTRWSRWYSDNSRAANVRLLVSPQGTNSNIYCSVTGSYLLPLLIGTGVSASAFFPIPFLRPIKTDWYNRYQDNHPIAGSRIPIMPFYRTNKRRSIDRSAGSNTPRSNSEQNPTTDSGNAQLQTSHYAH